MRPRTFGGKKLTLEAEQWRLRHMTLKFLPPNLNPPLAVPNEFQALKTAWVSPSWADSRRESHMMWRKSHTELDFALRRHLSWEIREIRRKSRFRAIFRVSNDRTHQLPRRRKRWRGSAGRDS